MAFLSQPILYWKGSENGGERRYLYFFGNPFVWWAGILGVLGTAYITLRKKLPSHLLKRTSFLLFGYLVFFAPFAFVARTTFLYHYLSAFVFSVILFAIFVDSILAQISKKKGYILFAGILILIFGSFLYLDRFHMLFLWQKMSIIQECGF